MVLKVTLSVWLQIISSLIKYNTYNIIVVLCYYKEKFKNGIFLDYLNIKWFKAKIFDNSVKVPPPLEGCFFFWKGNE